MIAVIADDLTGAAELAGIGLNYHLKTEIDTVVNQATTADLLIIATDTRSLPAAEAQKEIANITAQLLKLKPQLIFKKIDSVLRGNVLEEVKSQLEVSGLERALIVPGNPSHGKTVVDGTYYYQDKPVHLSNYANDPAFPVLSSDVKTMLRANGSVQVLKHQQALPATGISIGEVETDSDFDSWVDKAGNDTLIAGAAGLFESLLNHLNYKQATTEIIDIDFKKPRLFVFGSTFHKDKYRVTDGAINGITVKYIPSDFLFDEQNAGALADAYVNETVATLNETGSCIIAIHPEATNDQDVNPCTLTNKMGFLVKVIHQKIAIKELLIEGGATATAVLQHLKIGRLKPVVQLAPGVICTSVTGHSKLSVTLKPGSYQWPAVVWSPAN